MRIAQALIAAGCPGEALSFYPSEHAGATEILLHCDRSMFFGDESSLRAWHSPAYPGRALANGSRTQRAVG